MSEVVSQLIDQVIRLPKVERAAFVDYIQHHYDPEFDEPSDVVAEAWRLEIDRRVAEIRAGTAVGRPMDEVLAELRARRR